MPLIWLIYAYRYSLGLMLAPCCRFTPSCSEYALDAVHCHGPLRGSVLLLRRLLRCHPFSTSHGYDPVPLQSDSK